MRKPNIVDVDYNQSPYGGPFPNAPIRLSMPFLVIAVVVGVPWVVGMVAMVQAALGAI